MLIDDFRHLRDRHRLAAARKHRQIADMAEVGPLGGDGDERVAFAEGLSDHGGLIRYYPAPTQCIEGSERGA